MEFCGSTATAFSALLIAGSCCCSSRYLLANNNCTSPFRGSAAAAACSVWMAFGYSLASYARRPASRLASCLTVVAAITPLATHTATSSHFIRLTIPSFRQNQNFGRTDGYRHAISQINVSREGHQISLLQAAYYFIVRGISYAYVNLPLLQRSEEHTSELQSHLNLVCRLLLEKKKKQL